jgi:quercetin dioxygenase-like cupin family protein
MQMSKRTALWLSLILTVPALLLLAHDGGEQGVTKQASATELKIVTAADTQWGEGPPSLPTGAQMVILDGHPGKSGPFAIRLKMPAGYKIPPHTHTVAERLTVISGTVHLGIGEKFEESAGRQLNAGDFAVIPPGVAHFAWSAAEAVLQIHSEGPFQRKFVEPVHDSPAERK